MKATKRLFSSLIILLLWLNPAITLGDSQPSIAIFYPPVKPIKYNLMVKTLKHLDGKHKYGLKIEMTPWKRAYSRGLNGTGGVLGLSKNKERLELFDYSAVLYVDKILLVTLKEKAFPFSTIDDLKGKLVGGNAGSSYGDEFERGKKHIFIYEEDYRGATNRLKKLLQHRIDVALIGTGRLGFEEALSQDAALLANKDKFAILPTPLVEDPNFLGFAKKMGMKEFINRLNQDLKQAQMAGEIDAIIERQVQRLRNGN
ncbi:ABC transporter substrate-binding protein [Motiliproteus sp. MSK22-1]|uniref:substrate-binding periplasmic protein n=1 Tax=Motiliproteus sp. MSK22-1 TaxID=1897630 RepID=UPI0009759111|nr:ABC transporter substrate-binding protein [Motiliproteus sp. MSK22-1]OMH26613.1 hypothetical protein BGP75_23230 [Motiliproteus sp. MSK22-1]